MAHALRFQVLRRLLPPATVWEPDVLACASPCSSLLSLRTLAKTNIDSLII